jgi:pimeloyl-ACP methyl ester carboxylesterase
VSGEVSAERFEIHVEDAVLDDLRARLRRTRWATGVAGQRSGGSSGDAWKTGTDPAYLRDLIAYWTDGYDWRRREAALNALPQYRARVGDSHLHFVHMKGRGGQPTPLLLLHGWPDSFYRYHRVAPTFADNAFDVVVPSLPGFPFSGPLALAPRQPTRGSAELLWRLMTEVLGYQRFAVAGGDGGSVMAQILALDHPESIIALHLTDLGWHVATTDPASVSKPERRYLQAAQKRFMADGAYAMVQVTEPRTLAPALTDSPVGLASWIVDRFHSWSEPFAGDAGGDRQSGLSKDDLLTNIMLYWVTGAIAPSMFNYYAEASSPSLTPADRVGHPVAVALFPRDIGGVPPRALAERTLNVQRWTEMPRGGHFAALEVPHLFARDVIDFLRPLVAADRRLTGEPGHVHPAV